MPFHSHQQFALDLNPLFESAIFITGLIIYRRIAQRPSFVCRFLMKICIAYLNQLVDFLITSKGFYHLIVDVSHSVDNFFLA